VTPRTYGSRFLLASFFAVIILLYAGAVGVTIFVVSDTLEMQEKNLLENARHTGRHLELRQRHFVEDLKSFTALGFFEGFIDSEDSMDQATARLKRFYARHQNQIRRITVQDTNGRWASILRTQDNYYLISRDQEYGPLLYRNKTFKTFRQGEEASHVIPVMNEKGRVDYRVIVTTSLPDMFRSELGHIYLTPNSRLWVTDCSGSIIYSSDQESGRTFSGLIPEAVAADIASEICMGYEGRRQHAVDGDDSTFLTSFYPIRTASDTFGLAFSMNRSSLYGNILDEALALAGLFSIAFVVSVIFFRTLLRQREEAAKQAGIASKAKSRFLANVSHEIRTPMNAISGMAQLLDRDTTLNESQRENVRMILTATDNMMEIINDVLDISRIEEGRLDLAPVPADLRRMVSELVEMHAVTAQQKGVQVEKVFKDTPRWVRVDPLRLRQVLINLIGNAVKYTDVGTVTVTVADEGAGHKVGTRKVSFTVSDSGVGISDEDMERIFTPFTQGSDESRRYGGSGLGLAISNRLLRLMGSHIEATSAPGRGSTFEFTLELSPAEPATTKAAAAEKEHSSMDETRVLIAEDMPMNRLLLEKSLGSMGIRNVECVGNGEEAVEKALSGQYDYILMDVRMPVMDGLEASRRIRSAGIETPIIALTAQAMEEDRKACLDAGMNAYLPKPYKLDDLREIFEK